MATTTEGSIPQPCALGAKGPQCFPVAWHRMVYEVPLDDGSQPVALLGHGTLHALPQLCFDLMKFGREPFPHGDATDQKLPIPVLTTRVRHPQKIESLGLSPAKTPTVPVRKATESDQAGLFRMKLQRESLKPLAQCLGEAFCLVRMLKADDEIVGPSNDDDITFRMVSSPVLWPRKPEAS